MKIEYVPLIGFIVWAVRCRRNLTWENHDRLSVAMVVTVGFLGGIIALCQLAALIVKAAS